jgi:hypothetical protein
MVITLYNILLDTPHFLAYLASVGFGALRQGGRLGTAKTTAVRPNTKLSCAAHNSYIAGVETPSTVAAPQEQSRSMRRILPRQSFLFSDGWLPLSDVFDTPLGFDRI